MKLKSFFALFLIILGGIVMAENFDFSSTDLDGKAVTSDIFKNVDVTVVNIWGTFCPPCIREMPDLAKWNAEMPKNVQIIGIVCDVNSAGDINGIATAKTILQKSGVKFTNVIANASFAKSLQSIQFVPTTIIVDKNGNTIGEPIIGAKVNEYKKAVEAYLGKR